jgi:FolB domain-containing protein
MGKIIIRDLICSCIIGCKPEERTVLRDVILNIIMFTDISGVIHSDCVEDAVNYQEVAEKVKLFVEGSKFFLLEKLAAEVGGLIMKEFKVDRVSVCVDKPGAVAGARSVAIEVEFGQVDQDMLGE